VGRPIKIEADTTFTTLAPTNPQYDPSLMSLANGSYMMGFTDEATLGDPNAWVSTVARGGIAGQFVANAADIDEQHVSTAAFDSGAAMAFAWTERNDATGEFDIYVKVNALDRTGFVGAAILPRFLVNAGAAAGIQDRPEIVAIGSDRFAVAWIDRNAAKVYSAVYDINGGTIFAPAALSVSNSTQGFGSPTARIDIIPLNDSQYVVAYRADSFDAKFRIANTVPNVRFATDEIDVDGIAAGNGKSGIAGLSDGRFVIVYQQFDSIKGRIFNPDGTPSTDVFAVSPIVSADSLPQVAAFGDGRFMAVMSDGDDIIAQVMRPDGTPDGTAFVVNDVLTGQQTRPVISTLADGRVVVGWETNEAGNLDIKYAVFDPREAGVTILGTGVSDSYVGSRFDDTLVGANGTDRLAGGEGNDLLLGGPGADVLLGEGGNDVLDGGTGADDLNGGAGNDNLDGGGGNDDLTGGPGDDRYIFKPSSGGDTIFDFKAGAGTEDKIDLRAFQNIRTLGDILAHTAQVGSDAVIDFGNGDTLTLSHVGKSSLRVDDFVGLAAVPGDFFGDGKSDVVLRHNDGTIAIWHMNGTQTQGGGVIQGTPNSWHILSTAGDFNGDARGDVLLRNDDGAFAIWHMNGSQSQGGQVILGTPNAWQFQGVGDFNGDRTSDILLRHDDGTVSIWLINGGQVAAGGVIAGTPNAWQIQATGDFNGDNKTDVLLRSSDGAISIWNMDGDHTNGGNVIFGTSNAWHVEGTGDFNGDNTDDILLRNLDGTFCIWQMQNGQNAVSHVIEGTSNAWHFQETGDFNADNKSDILLRGDDGTFAVWLMNGGQIQSSGPIFGTPNAWHIEA
jgi:Ca2+-binding RTX toxin-like protein